MLDDEALQPVLYVSLGLMPFPQSPKGWVLI